MIQHHALMLYEKSNALYEYAVEQTATATYISYTLLAVALVSLTALLVKLYQWCCYDNSSVKDTQSIEAFAYEETIVHQDKDVERNKQQDY